MSARNDPFARPFAAAILAAALPLLAVLLVLLAPSVPTGAQTIVATVQMPDWTFSAAVNPQTGRAYAGMRELVAGVDL